MQTFILILFITKSVLNIYNLIIQQLKWPEMHVLMARKVVCCLSRISVFFMCGGDIILFFSNQCD